MQIQAWVSNNICGVQARWNIISLTRNGHRIQKFLVHMQNIRRVCNVWLLTESKRSEQFIIRIKRDSNDSAYDEKLWDIIINVLFR